MFLFNVSAQENEVEKKRILLINSILAISENPEELANTIMRRISLKDTPFEFPVMGILNDLRNTDQMTAENISNKWEYFSIKVNKQFYFSHSRIALIRTRLSGSCRRRSRRIRARSAT